MKPNSSKVAFIFILSIKIYHGGFIARTGTDCVCSGMNVTIQCSSQGDNAYLLIWDGSVLTKSNCEQSAYYFFRSQLMNGPLTMTCTAGNISMLGYKEQDIITSFFNVVMSAALNGTAINCTESTLNDTIITIGTHSLSICTIPADDIHIFVVYVGPDYFNFTWSIPDIELNHFPALAYQIQSNNCGMCIQAETNLATCSHYNISVEGQQCIVDVFAKVCGKIYLNNSVSFNLRVNEAPSVQSIAYYSYDTGKLIKIKTIIYPDLNNDHFIISDGIDGSPQYYTVMYFDSISNTNHCSSDIILASSCDELTCIIVLDISSSNCSSGDDISVNVYATNVLGNSPTSEWDTSVAMNNFVTVSYSSKSLECSLIDSKGIINCSATVALGNECQHRWGTYYGIPTSSEHIMQIHLDELETLTDDFHYFCFQVMATNGSKTIIVEGKINLSSTSNEVFLVLLMVLLPITFGALLYLMKNKMRAIAIYYVHGKELVTIKFSLRNIVGTLRNNILNVLNEYRVNIQVLGTLEYSEVDAKSSSETKDGYVRFYCSPTEVERLLKQLKNKEDISRAKRIKDKKLSELKTQMDKRSDYQTFILFALKKEEGSLYRGLEAFEVEGISFTVFNTLYNDGNIITALELEVDEGKYQVGYVACNCTLSPECCDSLNQKLTDVGAPFVKFLDTSNGHQLQASIKF